MLRSSSWNAASAIVPQLLALIISVVAARFLGPDLMGRQSFIAFVALSLTSFFSGGIAAMLMRFVGESLGAGNEATARGLVAWAWRFGLIGAAIGGPVMIATGLLGAEPTAAWVLAGIGCSLGIVQSMPNAVLVGVQQWRQVSIIGIVTGSLAVPLIIAVLAAGGGITGFFAIELMMIAANLIWSGIVARRALSALTDRVEHDLAVQRRAAAYAGWATISVALAMVVFKRSEFVFLDIYASNTDIALYSIAFAAVYAVTLLSESLANTMLPAFATLYGGHADARIRVGFERGQRLLLMFSLPLTAGTIALGPRVLATVYGDAYAGSGQLLQIMAVGLPLLALLGLANSFLGGIGKVKPLLAITAIAAIADVVLAFVLVPPLQARGAAIANLASQGVVAVITISYASRLLGRVHIHARTAVANLAASAAGGVLAAAAVAAISGVPGLLVGLIVGIAAFAAIAATIKVIRPDDAHWLVASSSGTLLARPAALACRAFAFAAPPPPVSGGA